MTHPASITDTEKMHLPPFRTEPPLPILRIASLYSLSSPSKVTVDEHTPSGSPTSLTTSDKAVSSSPKIMNTYIPSSAPWDIWIPRNMDGSKVSSTYEWYISLFISTVNEFSAHSATTIDASPSSFAKDIPNGSENLCFTSLPSLESDASGTSVPSSVLVSLPTSFDNLYFIHRYSSESTGSSPQHTYTLPSSLYHHYHQLYIWLQQFQSFVEKEGINNPVEGLRMLGIIPLSSTLLDLQTSLEKTKTSTTPSTPTTDTIDITLLHHVTLALKYCLMITYHTSSSEQIHRWYNDGIIAYNYSLILWLWNWLDDDRQYLPLTTLYQILECFVYCLRIEEKYYQDTDKEAVTDTKMVSSSSSSSSTSTTGTVRPLKIVPFLVSERILTPPSMYRLCVYCLDCVFYPYGSNNEYRIATATTIHSPPQDCINYRLIYTIFQLFERYLDYSFATVSSSPVHEILRIYHHNLNPISTVAVSANDPERGNSDTSDPEFQSLFQQWIYYLLLVIGTVGDDHVIPERDFLDQCITEYFQLPWNTTDTREMGEVDGTLNRNEIELSLPQKSIQYMSTLYCYLYVQTETPRHKDQILVKSMGADNYVNLLYKLLVPSIGNESSSVASTSSTDVSSSIPASLAFTRQVWGTRFISLINNLCRTLTTSSRSGTITRIEYSSTRSQDNIPLFCTLFFLNQILQSFPSITDDSTNHASLSSSEAARPSPPSSPVYRFFHSLFYMNDRSVLVDILTKQLYNTSTDEVPVRIMDLCILRNIHQCTLNEGFPAVHKEKITNCLQSLSDGEPASTVLRQKDNLSFLASLYQQSVKKLQEALATPELEY